MIDTTSHHLTLFTDGLGAITQSGGDINLGSGLLQLSSSKGVNFITENSLNLGAVDLEDNSSFRTTSGNITFNGDVNTNNHNLSIQSPGTITRNNGTLITGTGQIALESVGLSQVSVNTAANMIATVGALSVIGLQTLNLGDIASQGAVSLSTLSGDLVFMVI